MIELKKLSIDDKEDVYELLQDIPADENGFHNSAYGLSYEEYKNWLIKKNKDSLQVGLVDGWRVPATTFFLYVDGIPVGTANLRHFLTDALRVVGGHIGYCVSPKYRGKGYGKEMLRLMLDEAKKIGLDKVLITANSDNLASIGVAKANGCIITDQTSERVHMWIDIK